MMRGEQLQVQTNIGPAVPSEKFKAKAVEVEDENARFAKSLQELKELRSQLSYAADYCEMSFNKTKQKKMVLENTKDYICKAMVTVVDHLGSISANLEYQFLENKQISDTEIRLQCLKQRLLTCENYTTKLALSKVRWMENIPRHQKHYVSLSTSNLEKLNGASRNPVSVVPKIVSKNKLEMMQVEASRLLNTFTHRRSQRKLSGVTLSSMVPVQGNPFLVSIPRNPSFHFQESEKPGCNERNRGVLKIPWRSKHTAWKDVMEMYHSR